MSAVGFELARSPAAGSKIWSSPVLGVAPGAATVIGHTVYVSALYNGKDGYLHALRDSDGSEIWSMRGNGTGGFSAPVIIGETLVVGTENGELHAMRASGGGRLWSRPITAGANAVPVAGNGIVYVAGSVLNAYRATDGRPLWSFPGGTPVVATDGVYVPGSDGRVHALDPSTGTPIWKSDPLNVTAILAVTEGTLYTSSSTGNHIHALQAGNGGLLWSFPAGGYQVTGCAADANMVFIGTNSDYSGPITADTPNGHLYAVRANNGEQAWQFPAKGGAHNIVVADQLVYLSSAAGRVYALQRTGGSRVWHSSQDVSWQYGPVKAGNAILLTADNSVNSSQHIISATNPNSGHLYALRASDHTEIWDFRTGADPGQPVAANGVVYVWCYDGNVYAIRALCGCGLLASSPACAGGTSMRV